MRLISGCESSGRVRDAFAKKGHDSWSCDILPPETKTSRHLQTDIEVVLEHYQWDMAILFPPCTHLCVSGARWFEGKRKAQLEAVAFFFRLLLLTKNINKTAIENPIGIMSSLYRKPDQIIQPWMFGTYETKSTCLWLKGLPLLKPQYKTAEECREAMGINGGIKPDARVHKMAPGPNRATDRARTYQVIAAAMAEQWGN